MVYSPKFALPPVPCKHYIKLSLLVLHITVSLDAAKETCVACPPYQAPSLQAKWHRQARDIRLAPCLLSSFLCLDNIETSSGGARPVLHVVPKVPIRLAPFRPDNLDIDTMTNVSRSSKRRTYTHVVEYTP